MPSIGTNSKPAYVYDAGTDTWIPIGPGEHTHDYAASAHNHDSTYIAKTLTNATGDIIYASAANTPARLGIGSSNQLLRVSSGGIPEWATVSAGSLTLLSTTTLTGQNVSITGISQNYTDLIISIYQVNPSNTANLFVELRNGANPQTISVAGYTGNAFSNYNQNSSIQIGGGAFITGETANNNYIYVQDYKSTTEYKRNLNSRGLFTTSGFALTGYNYDGYINGTSAINAVFVDLAGTNTFSSGTVQIWGVN